VRFFQNLSKKNDTTWTDMQIGCQQLRVAYKLRLSDFNPITKYIDLIVERVTIALISDQSHE